MQLNILTPEELYKLTKYKRKAEQKRWLGQHGIRYLEAADGSPNVALEVINTILGIGTSFSAPKKPKLDLDAIKAYGKNDGSKTKRQ